MRATARAALLGLGGEQAVRFAPPESTCRSRSTTSARLASGLQALLCSCSACHGNAQSQGRLPGCSANASAGPALSEPSGLAAVTHWQDGFLGWAAKFSLMQSPAVRNSDSATARAEQTVPVSLATRTWTPSRSRAGAGPGPACHTLAVTSHRAVTVVAAAWPRHAAGRG